MRSGHSRIVGGGLVVLLAVVAGVFLWSRPHRQGTRRETRPPRGTSPSPAPVTAARVDAHRREEPDAGVVSDPPCIQVRALDYQGRRADAELSVQRAPGARWRTLRASAPGEAEVCAGIFTVFTVRAITREGAGGVRTAFADEWRSRPLLLRVARPATVRGRVITARGEPVPDVPIAIRPRWGALSATQGAEAYALEPARTDGLGRFVVRLIGANTYHVGAQARGSAQTWRGPFAGRPGAHYETEIRLLPGATFSVAVVGGEGVPIPGAMLWEKPSRLTIELLSHRLPDGRFVRRGLRRDARFDVHVDAPGFVSRHVRDLAVGHHTINLERAVEVAVEVQVEAPLDRCLGAQVFEEIELRAALWRDSPLSTRVSARLLGGERGAATTTLERSRGTLTFDDVGAGPATLTVTMPGASVRSELTLRGPATRAPPVRLTIGDRAVLRLLADAPLPYSIRDAAGRGESGGVVAPWTCLEREPGIYSVNGVRVEARRGVVVDVRLVELPEQPVERGICPPPFEVEAVEHGVLEVVSLGGDADGQVLPGDRIVETDDGPVDRLDRPPGTISSVLVERPDASRQWIQVVWGSCD